MELKELYTQRTLIFIEEEPQSNKYRQVILTPEEFKRVSDNLGRIASEADGIEQIEINLSDEIYTLPDLKDISYGKEKKG